MRNRLGEDADAGTSFSDQLHTNLDKYLTECETEGYPYDFIVTAVSGVFSDNAPPSAEIMETIRAYNEKYGQEVRVEMVSLQELYAAIAPKLTDAPVYRGDWTDWWAIRLCDGAAENNARPLYSWVMNNNWETNFKMDLSGFCQYDYSLWLTDISDPEQAMDELHEQLFDPYVLIVR